MAEGNRHNTGGSSGSGAARPGQQEEPSTSQSLTFFQRFRMLCALLKAAEKQGWQTDLARQSLPAKDRADSAKVGARGKRISAWISAREEKPSDRTDLLNVVRAAHVIARRREIALPDEVSVEAVMQAFDRAEWVPQRHLIRVVADSSQMPVFGLGVHRAIGPTADTTSSADVRDDRPGMPRLPQYLPRPAYDDELRIALAKVKQAKKGTGRALIALVGDSSTGKTRMAVEAVCAVLPSWSIHRPHDAVELNNLLAGRDTQPRTVLWLDGLEFFLGPGVGREVAQRLRNLLDNPAGVAPFVVIATTWPSHWRTLATPPRAREHGDPTPQDSASTSSLLALASTTEQSPLVTKIEIPTHFTQGELRQAGHLALHDPHWRAVLKAHREATKRGPGSRNLLQLMAGGPQVLEWYRANADASVHDETASPYAAALVSTVLDAVRLGRHRGLPYEALQRASADYLTERDLPDYDGWFDEALDRACAPLATGGPPPLRQANDGGYLATDYLVQRGLRPCRCPRHSQPCDCRRLPHASLWWNLGDVATTTKQEIAAADDDLARMAEAARRRGLYQVALHLCRLALEDRPSLTALSEWGITLHKSGHLTGNMRALRLMALGAQDRAASPEHTTEKDRISSYQDPASPAEAEAATALASRDPAVLRAQARALSTTAPDSAAQLELAADSYDWLPDLQRIGQLLQQAKRKRLGTTPAPETADKEADRVLGDSPLAAALVLWRQRRGDKNVTAYARLDELGFPHSGSTTIIDLAQNLTQELDAHGRQDQADAVWADLVRARVRDATRGQVTFLHFTNRNSEAVAVLRREAEQGERWASQMLADVLEETGHIDDAVAVRRALAVDTTAADTTADSRVRPEARQLAELLMRHQRYQQAARVWWSMIYDGDASAVRDLIWMLHDMGSPQDEIVWRTALEAGAHSDSCDPLAELMHLFLLSDRPAEAGQLAHYGIQPGGTIAAPWQSPFPPPESEQWIREEEPKPRLKKSKDPQTVITPRQAASNLHKLRTTAAPSPSPSDTESSRRSRIRHITNRFARHAALPGHAFSPPSRIWYAQHFADPLQPGLFHYACASDWGDQCPWQGELRDTTEPDVMDFVRNHLIEHTAESIAWNMWCACWPSDTHAHSRLHDEITCSSGKPRPQGAAWIVHVTAEASFDAPGGSQRYPACVNCAGATIPKQGRWVRVIPSTQEPRPQIWPPTD